MKKILIVSHYIAPLASIASVRWTKISKYLKKDYGDIYITVITDKKKFDRENSHSFSTEKYDELLAKDMCYFDEMIEVETPRITDKIYQIYTACKREKEKQKDEGKEKAVGMSQKIPSLPTSIFIELRDLLLMIKTNKKIQKLNFKGYDIVISSCGPLWTHGVAHYLKKRYPQIKWLADYRDPVTDKKENFFLRRWHRHQSNHYTKNADVIIKIQDDLLTDSSLNVMRQTISNGFDPDEMIAPKPPSNFSIVYTGSILDKERADFSMIFQAINDMSKWEGVDRKDIKVVYAGVSGDIANEYAYGLKSEDIFENKWFVDREEAIELQRTAAILLQSKWNTNDLHIFWSGKMYEYMTAEKPIVYIVNGDVPYSMPSKYMDKLGGICYEACRHDELYFDLCDYIYKTYMEWKNTGNVTVVQDKEYIKQFSYINITKKLWKLIQ